MIQTCSPHKVGTCSSYSLRSILQSMERLLNGMPTSSSIITSLRFWSYISVVDEGFPGQLSHTTRWELYIIRIITTTISGKGALQGNHSAKK